MGHKNQADPQTTGFQEEQKALNGTESTRNIIMFCSLGLMVFTILYLGMTAAQDILKGTAMPTSSVLLTTAGPFFLATLIAPYFIPRVQATVRIAIVFVLGTSGILLTALGNTIGLKLTGVALVSLGCGVAETSFLALTVFYEAEAVNAYSGGTGAGFAMGSLYYTALTTWACVSPQITILTICALPLAILLLYCLLKKNDGTQDKRPTHKSVSYTQLKSEHEPEEINYTWKEKCQTIWRTLPLTLVLVIGVMCEYLTIQAVVTTLAFPNSPFSPRDHYQFYFFAFSAGEFIGRSYAIAMYYFKVGCISLTKHTWIFTGIMGTNLIFLTCASWYRFLPFVWTVMAILFEHGISAGALYVNTFSMAGKSETDARSREFSRAFATIGSGLGLLAAGFIGLNIEPQLKEHCIAVASSVMEKEFCFTRLMQGWNSTGLCR